MVSVFFLSLASAVVWLLSSSWPVSFDCFTSSVSLTCSYTDEEPKTGGKFQKAFGPRPK